MPKKLHPLFSYRKKLKALLALTKSTPQKNERPFNQSSRQILQKWQ
jgi:hypothetical protein